MLERAIEIAARAHAGQPDKAGAPYILHPLRVMFAVQGASERMAAVLHDVVEDTEVTLADLRAEGFPEDVLVAVDCLTKRKGESRIDAARRAANNPIARAVKLADVSDNMDLSRIAYPTDKDFARLREYVQVRAMLLAPRAAAMNELNFEVGVWHPFGPHGRETVEQIIQRKRQEIQANGWTLWSFQYRRMEVLEEWSRCLSAAKNPVAFCSNSPGAVDPSEVGPPTQPISCRSYKPAFHNGWLPFPAAVKVPHPLKNGKTLASAFIVRHIVHPFELADPPSIQWLSNGEWRDTSLPTRGEYLIRSGGAARIRPIRALLELQAPFLATVNADAVAEG